MFQRLGLPASIGQMLSPWTNQSRYIEYEGCVLQAPAKVTSSLPQRDAWSLYGLIALLAPPTMDVQISYPDTVHKTYVDDRSWASNSCAEALAVEQIWQRWTNILGLKENATTSQYFHQCAKGRRCFIENGISQEKVSDSPCLLGCKLQDLVRRKLFDKERGRLHTARKRTLKIARLPVPKDKKQRLAASAAISLAEHGWVQKLPAQADFRIVEGAVNQLCEEPGLTSPHLRNIFRNHRLDLQSRVLQHLVDAAVRSVRDDGCRSPGAWSKYHGWSSCIHRLVLRQGCGYVRNLGYGTMLSRVPKWQYLQTNVLI